MKFKKIYIGSWVPRTIVHIEEFYDFLKNKKTNLSLDNKKLLDLYKKLKVLDFKIDSNIEGCFIYSKFDKIDFLYKENGLMIFSKEIEDLKKDSKYITDFSVNNILKTFSYLYSLGAPIPKIFTSMFSVMPFIIEIETTNQKDIEKIFLEKNEKINKEIKDKDFDLFLGGELVVFNNKNKIKNQNLIFEKIIFLSDVKSQFSKIINLHRFIWEELDKIRKKNNIKLEKITQVRDSLLELNNEVIFFSSRLEQIKFNIDKEINNLEKNYFNKKIENFLKIEFKTLFDTSDYVNNLWKMTQNNVDSTLNLISLIYQENTEKQLNVLQIIFIVSAVASVIALGSIYGFNFNVMDNYNNVLYHGNTVSFSIRDFIKFGFFAILGASIIYFLFFFVFRKFSSFKITNTREFEENRLKNIKNMFKK